MSDLEVRALDLFDQYVELAPLQRSSALQRLQAYEPALHDALLRLLTADAAGHPLEGVAFDALSESPAEDDADPSATRIGNRLGPWRIDRVIGSGGMGTVYEACRADGEYEKQVALKCMRAEMSSPHLIDAFMRERNHLAHLDHPNIAPLLDGGIEADGRPWFAMRLVHGTAMDLWADQQRLTLAERIRLLLQACDALRYAHGHGVLHQDIKPGNLLVSADGRVHLVDFGLSAVTGSLDGAAPARIAISNGYAAPEILHGAAASAASDIYSLGVMLYQLLVGDWPRPLVSLHAALIGLSSTDSARAPSTLAATAAADVARARGYPHPRQLRKRLQGDLDAIALRAVATSPADRYGSVEALTEDLEHWLARRPVRARGGRRLYVIQRFLQRNALASTLAGGVLVAGVTSAGVLGWLQLQDRQALRDTRAVSTVFEQTLGVVTLSGLAEARPSSRLVLENAETQLRALSLPSSPAIKARALASLARSYAALGDYPHALTLAGEANRLLANHDGDPSDTLAMLAMLLNLQARHAEARDIATQGLQRSASTHVAAPATLDLLVELARAHWALSEYDASFDTLAFAQESAAGLSSRAARDVRIELLVLRGEWHLQLMDLAGAERDLQRAAAAALGGTPSLEDSVNEARLRWLLLAQRYGEATELAATLFDARRQRLGPDHPDTARSLRLQLEVAEQRAGTAAVPAGALMASRQAIVAAYGTQHPEFAHQLLLEARLASHEDPRKGFELAQQSVQLLERALGPRHPATLSAKEAQARALMALAATATDAWTRRGEAASLLQEVIHANTQRHWPSPTARYWLAQALLERDTPAESSSPAARHQAETLLQDALVEARRHLGARHATTAMIREALVGAPWHDATQAVSSDATRTPVE
ncbi:serine/threonine-protein kinase [Pseudoxanthomonas sp.]|uniref:serine/threonine-protein kinase n=1 Tax=Pseudoxanthomonas sp. TaxID=1871049 RepID=UPI002FDF21DE